MASSAPRPVDSASAQVAAIGPGNYVLTAGSVFGYTDRFSVACNVTIDDGLQVGPGDFTPAIEAACLQALAQLVPQLA